MGTGDNLVISNKCIKFEFSTKHIAGVISKAISLEATTAIWVVNRWQHGFIESHTN